MRDTPASEAIVSQFVSSVDRTTEVAQQAAGRRGAWSAAVGPLMPGARQVVAAQRIGSAVVVCRHIRVWDVEEEPPMGRPKQQLADQSHNPRVKRSCLTQTA